MLSANVIDILKENNFFDEDPGVAREWTKEIEVAFYGKSIEVYKVAVIPLSKEAVRVMFLKNKRIIKQKNYTSSAARTINAIKETVQCAGYEF